MILSRCDSASAQDLTIEPTSSGTWSAWNYVTLWITGFHSIPGYMFMMSPLHGGFSRIAVVMGTVAGALVLAAVCLAGAYLSHRHRRTFPGLIVDIFGMRAAILASVLRGTVAIAWYGIQTYLAVIMLAACVSDILGTSGPATAILGLSAMQWVALLIVSLLQFSILARGTAIVRWVSDASGPVIWLCLVGLVVWKDARGSSITARDMVGGAISPLQVITVAALTVAFLGGPAVNYADFARHARSFRSVRTGTAMGIVGNAFSFVLVSILIDQQLPNGSQEPFASFIARTASAVAIGLTVVLTRCNIGANVVLNFVSAVYDLQRIIAALDRRRAAALTSVAAIFTFPGLWFTHPSGILTFVSMAGAAVGALACLLIVAAWTESNSVGEHQPLRVFVHSIGFGVLAEIIVWASGHAFDCNTAAFAWPAGAIAAAVTCACHVSSPIPGTRHRWNTLCASLNLPVHRSTN